MKKLKHTPKNIFLPALFLLLSLNIVILDVIVMKYVVNVTSNVLGINTKASDTPCPKSCIDSFAQYSSIQTGSIKEQYVSLGTGSGFSSDWTDIAGIEATVDTGQYRKIKTATFDTTVNPQTGNGTVWVRLFNATDKHPVWFSEVTMSGAGPVLLTSKPITLDSGKKLYKVQIKTQLSYPVSVLQSRIHILTY